MSIKGKRFEFVMDEKLHSSVANRAETEGISIAEIIRNLLLQWDAGEINKVNIDYKPIERGIGGECKFYLSAPCNHVYEFSVIASSHSMTRIELTQLLIESVINGRINIDCLLCDCYQ